jgi:hypothetical protein
MTHARKEVGMAKDLEIVERKDFLEARYLGSYALDRYKSLMQASVLAAKDRKLTRLLVDIRSMTNFAPSTADRYELGKFGAEISARLRVALLVTAEQAKDTFATLVAKNRGLQIETFTDRAAAEKWLLNTPS